MLEYLSSKKEKDLAQRQLMAAINGSLPDFGSHMIGFPGPGKTEEHRIRCMGADSLYYAYSSPNDEDNTPRHWNSFGFFRRDRRVQHIVVEANIASTSDSGRVSGFYARDSETRTIYLMHSGRVGGGSEGIGKSAFLDYLSDRPELVRHGKGTRQGLRIGALNDPNLTGLIGRFVEKVESFKNAVKSGTLKRVDSDDDTYFQEFWGKKQGQRGKAVDYESYHGLVVDALKEERSARRQDGETMDKDRLIDLFVRRHGRLIEVYEVKTSTQRQSLYTAIGQLVTHGWGTGVERILLVPNGDDLTADCGKALKRLGIQLRRYTIIGSKKRIRVELGD